MWMWLKMFLAVVVAVMPGGFVILLAYALARVFREQSLKLQAEMPNQPIPVGAVVRSIHFRDVVRQARLHH
jgi:hypothetical protein